MKLYKKCNKFLKFFLSWSFIQAVLRLFSSCLGQRWLWLNQLFSYLYSFSYKLLFGFECKICDSLIKLTYFVDPIPVDLKGKWLKRPAKMAPRFWEILKIFRKSWKMAVLKLSKQPETEVDYSRQNLPPKFPAKPETEFSRQKFAPKNSNHQNRKWRHDFKVM